MAPLTVGQQGITPDCSRLIVNENGFFDKICGQPETVKQSKLRKQEFAAAG